MSNIVFVCKGEVCGGIGSAMNVLRKGRNEHLGFRSLMDVITIAPIISYFILHYLVPSCLENKKLSWMKLQQRIIPKSGGDVDTW